MSVTAETNYTVKCDYCVRIIAGPSPHLADTVSLALARAGHRYDRSRGAGEQWECYDCRAKRQLGEERNLSTA